MTWFSEFKLKENNIRLILSIFLIIFLIGFVSADFKFENTSGTELMRIFSSSGNLSLLGKINASDVCVGDICLGSLGESVSGDYVPYTGATKNVNLGLNNFTINTNVFHVDALSGRVGIGTVSPNYGKLHVSGDGNEGGIRVGDSSTTFRIYTNSSTNAAYLTRGGVDTQGIVIDSSGKIGIGTTSPQASLHVNYPTSGNVIFQAGTGDGSSDMNMKLGYNDYGWYWKYLGTGSGDNNELQLWSEGAGSTDQQVYGIKQSGKLTFYKELNLSNNKIVNLANGTSNYDAVTKIQLDAISSTVSGDYVPYTGATKSVNLNAMNLTNVGRIGIGTSNPSYLLHLSGGDLRSEGTFRTGISGDPGRWRFYDSSGYLMSFWTEATDFDTWGLYWDTSDNEMRWMGNGNLKSSIDLDDGSGYFQGNVGIGTISPQQKLHVNGSAIFNGTINLDGNKIIGLGNGTAAQDAVTYSQLQAISSTVSGDYVPYTGATKSVNLGAQTLTTTGAVSTGALTSTTINTGQGATEVYLMDQNIRTTDGVSFATLNTGQGANELYAMNQNVRTTDNVSFNNIKIGNDQWISAVDSSGSGYVNMFKVNSNNEIVVGGNLNIGSLVFASDSGLISAMDMPVSSVSSVGSPQGYVFKMDGDNIMSVYSESDGVGGVQNKRIGIGTISPTATLDVNGTANIRGALTMNNNKISGLGNGSLAQDAVTYSQMIFTNSSMKSYVDAQVGSSGTMSSWSIGASSGTAQTISDGQTMTIAQGTGLTTSVGGTRTVTIGIANAGVGENQLANGAVTNYKIGFNAINSSQLIANSVNSTHIINGAITSDDLANGAVTNYKIGFNAINSSQLIANSVNSTHIINGAITSDDLANGAVTNYKIAANAVNITQTTFTDQNLTASSTPTFNRLNITNAPTQGSHALNRDAGDARYVNLAGDTMTGNLTLANAPSLDLHAATKKYVDEAVTTGVGSGISGTLNYIPKFTGANTIGNSVIYENGGNIGIGTTSPSYKLDIEGSFKGGGRARIETSRSIGGVTGDTVALGSFSNDGKGKNIKIYLKAHTGSTIDVLTFDINDHAYIGSTTNWLEIPLSDGISYTGVRKLGVDVYRQNIGSTSDPLFVRIRNINSAGSGTVEVVIEYDDDVIFTPITLQSSTSIVFNPSTSPAGGIVSGIKGNVEWNFPVSNGNAWKEGVYGLYIKNNGNVGIGTISPQQKLHVTGNAVFNGTINMDSNKIINLANGTSNYDAVTKIQLDAVSNTVSGDFVPYSGATKNVNLGANNFTVDTNVLHVDSNNNRVGIGTVSPSEALEVSGKIKVSQNTMEANSVTFDGSTSIGLRLTNANGYISMTPLNTGWAHIYTDRSNFIFNKPVYSVDDAFSSYDADLKLQRAGTTKLTLGSSSATFASEVNMNSNKITSLANGSSSQDAVTYSQLTSAVSSTYSGWTLTGDSGTSQTISSGNTVNISGGVGINTTVGATDKLIINIKQGGVGSDQLANNAVIKEKISANAVNASHITSNSINSTHIVNGAIISDDLGNGAVIKEKISANAVNASHITSNSINSTHIVNGAITSDDLGNGAVTNFKIRDGSALSVIGRTANSDGQVADIAASGANQVLRVDSAGNYLGFGAINLAESAAVTGALGIGNGGTGATSADSARVNLNVVNKSGDTMTGSLLFNGSDINLGTVNAHSLKLITGGSERIGIESDGKISFKSSNVGIATSGIGSNTEKLFIQSDSGQSPLKVKANTVDALYIDSSGKVEIGSDLLLTGTPTTTNQGRMIDFTGFDKEGTTDFSDRAYIQHTVNTGGHSGSVLVLSSQNDDTDGIAFLTNAASQLKHNSHVIWDAGNDDQLSQFDANSYTSGSASAGWVTIATSSDSRGFGEVYVWDVESGDHAFMQISWMRSYADTSATVINSGGHSRRLTGVRVIRDSDVTYGVKKLQVYSTVSSSYRVRIKDNSAMSGFTSISVYTPTTENLPSGWTVQTGVEGLTGGGGNLATTGNVYATAFYYTSDRAKKENITNISGALDLVKKMQGVGFNFRDDEDKEHKVGFIAQDMELVLPEVVHGENGSMTVDYASVSAVLVEAVKELDAVSLERYKKQQEEIEDLRKEMELLKKEMEALKKG